MSEKSTAAKKPTAAQKAPAARGQETAKSRSAPGRTPAKFPDTTTSGSLAAPKQRIRQATKGLLGATTPALSKFASTANNPAADARLAAARGQLTSRLANPAYQESRVRAAKRFKGFNLSKFAKSKTPQNYIDPKKMNDRAAVHAKQKELIANQLKKLKDKETQNCGLTLAVPMEMLAEVKKALPGMDEKGGNIELEHLLAYLRRHLSGTSFYSRGSPVITRLTTEMKARAHARKIIEKIKKRAKEGTAAATSKNSQGAAPSNKEEAHGDEKRRWSQS